ncbi:hypothetical protein B296_00016828 [Ensete ventricosum]|uniref:Uncharacterized protein n=1 Tax=Ensete ventricosum TaxID=4639 RepID=A0A426Y9W1_ENSVE|nr:hypothetical protein B296_00016828 [Ensete ventricosum]
MQRLEHGRRSVRGHPKVRSELSPGSRQWCTKSSEVVERGEEATTRPEGLSYPKSKVSVRKEVDSEERHSVAKADLQIAKGYRCKATDSRAMDLAAPWYRRGGTSVESSIPCSHGGRTLVVKGAEDVENAEANSKYQDRTEG